VRKRNGRNHIRKKFQRMKILACRGPNKPYPRIRPKRRYKNPMMKNGDLKSRRHHRRYKGPCSIAKPNIPWLIVREFIPYRNLLLATARFMGNRMEGEKNDR
jgi:hypothetical protein